MIRETQIETGLILGIPAADPRITAFRGIPYADKPVDQNRFRAPQPCKPWQCVLDCARFAPIPMQWTPGQGDNVYVREWHVDKDIPMSEDCLYLNVWTPAKDQTEKLPVLVWFYGGGLQCGYTAEMEFDGERIARRGIVVVTAAYRVGVFGFFAHPDLSKQQPDAPANFGHLDQQAALQWVQRNIQAFGGDPARVTLAGQSAGGGSVLAQMACTANQGLFHGAVVMSAMIRDPYGIGGIPSPKPLEEAEKDGEAFLQYTGIPDFETLKVMDARSLQDKYEAYLTQFAPFLTVKDDRFCCGDPLVRLVQGACLDVPMMVGHTADEFPSLIPVSSETQLEAFAQKQFGRHADAFLALPQAHEKAPDGYAKVSGLECTIKGVLEKRAQMGHPGYYYCFDAEIPGWDQPGTFHSVDLWFFFETLGKCWRPFTGKHYDLSRQMCDYLCYFIKYADPNGLDQSSTPLPYWAPYRADAPCGMYFGPRGAEATIQPLKGLQAFARDRILETLEASSDVSRT